MNMNFYRFTVLQTLWCWSTWFLPQVMWFLVLLRPNHMNVEAQDIPPFQSASALRAANLGAKALPKCGDPVWQVNSMHNSGILELHSTASPVQPFLVAKEQRKTFWWWKVDGGFCLQSKSVNCDGMALAPSSFLPQHHSHWHDWHDMAWKNIGSSPFISSPGSCHCCAHFTCQRSCLPRSLSSAYQMCLAQWRLKKRAKWRLRILHQMSLQKVCLAQWSLKKESSWWRDCASSTRRWKHYQCTIFQMSSWQSVRPQSLMSQREHGRREWVFGVSVWGGHWLNCGSQSQSAYGFKASLWLIDFKPVLIAQHN